MLSPLRTITDDFKDLFDLDHQSWSGVTGFDSSDSPDLQVVKASSKWNSGMIGRLEFRSYASFPFNFRL
jgi:hypothetical protein